MAPVYRLSTNQCTVWYVVDTLTPLISTDGFMVYNRHSAAPFGKEERGTSPLTHPMVTPTILNTNDEHLILSTPNDPIIFCNDSVMEIAQPGINTAMYLPNLLFIEEEY